MAPLPPIILPPPAGYYNSVPTLRQEHATTERPLCIHSSGAYNSRTTKSEDEAAFLEEAFALSQSRVVFVRPPFLFLRLKIIRTMWEGNVSEC